MLELEKVQRVAVSMLGAIVFTAATILAAAAPAEVSPQRTYAAVQAEAQANG